jgi:hypothetical protein
MTLPTTDPPCVPIWLAVVVALAGAVVGGFFGSAAGMWLYGGPQLTETGELHFSGLRITVGMVLGAGSGVAVAVGWSLLMRYLSVRASGLTIIAVGAGLGLAAGVVSTVILHAGLGVSWTTPVGLSYWELEWLFNVCLSAAVLGAPAGLVTGLVCGLVAWGVSAIARRKRASAAVAAPPNP